MDRFRYLLGVVGMVTYPPGLSFWFIVHPFARKWRMLGPVGTYLIVFPVLAAFGALLFAARRTLLGADLGTRWSLIGASSIFYGAMGWLSVAYRRHLSTTTLIGVPELTRGQSQQRLLQEGIYSKVRHPRYLSVLIGGVGYALIVNYVGIYLLAALAIPVIYLITLIEERELVERFGDAYRAYQRTVPRLIPALRRT